MAETGESPAPKAVSRFEANLLRVLRFFLKQVPAEQALRLVHDRLDRPKCLSAAAVHLVQDSLAKGGVLYLIRAGAWKRDRFLRDGNPKFGRLWDRSPVADLGLTFSKHALDFLVWITAVRPKEEKPVWRVADKQLTVGDRLLFFLAYEALRVDPELTTVLRTSPVFGTHALIWLAHPNDFAGETAAPDFGPWLTGQGALVLEAMQPVLEHRWLEVERTKGQIGDWAQLSRQARPRGRLGGRLDDGRGRRRPARPGAVPGRGPEPAPGRAGHEPGRSGPVGCKGPARRGWPTGWRRSGMRCRYSVRPTGSASGSGRPAGPGIWTRSTRRASSGWASGSGSTSARSPTGPAGCCNRWNR